MSLIKIQVYPYQSLRDRASKVARNTLRNPEFQQFANDLMETLVDQFPLGAGLAANQVNKLNRVFAINLEIGPGNFLKQLFINPEIIESSKNTDIDWEGCLSFPDQWAQVKRPTSVKIRALNPAGEIFETNASHFYARLIQHEIDHLDGVLFIDKKLSDIIDTNELNQILTTEDQSYVNVG